MPLSREILEICDSVQTLTGATVCLYDYTHGLTVDADASDRLHFGHYCKLCRAVKNLKTPELSGREACISYDTVRLKTFAAQMPRPFLSTCHLGLTELIVPIRMDEKLAGLAFIGQCRVEKKDDRQAIVAAGARFGGDPAEIGRLYDALPLVSVGTLYSAGTLLDMALKHIVEQYRALDLPKNLKPTLASRCEGYIRVNYRLPITAGTVAEALHVNQSYLSRVFRADMGMTMQDYLTNMRLEHAKSLLTTTNLPISVVAENSGFIDNNYFSRVFRLRVGESPTAYREHHGN